MVSAHQAVFDGFVRFRAAWPQRGWTFDNRFECVASSFDADFAPSARLLIAPLFPGAFNEKTLATASLGVREAAARTGGVRSTQMIFGAERSGRATPYALWWPWEEARTISLRIGLEGATPAELLDLCECFGIRD